MRPRSRDVALQSPDEARVRIGVDEHLDVHQVAQRRIGEHQDAFNDQRAPRLKGFGLRQPRVPREIVLRHVHGRSRFQRAHVRDHEIRFERVGMIVVERGTLLEAQVVAIAVVAIVIQQRHLLRSEAVDNPPDHGGFP